MTLAEWRTQFWSFVRSSFLASNAAGEAVVLSPAEIEEMFPAPDVTTKLNIGWSRAVEAIGGYGALEKSKLDKDKEEYALPDYVLRVLRVTITNSSGDIVATPTKVNYKWLARKTGKPIKSSSKPRYWAWAPRGYYPPMPGSQPMTVAKMLRIYPAYNETVPDGLWVEMRRTTNTVTEPDEAPQLSDSLAEAGLNYACYLATRNAQFLYDFNGAIASWIRATGGNTGTEIKHEPVYYRR